jgi:hypothetical protein
MADLYGTSGAISLGNMRTQMVRDMNNHIKEHNEKVQTTIQGLQSQASSGFLTKEIRDQAINLWTGKDIPGKINEFNKYFADRAAGKSLGTNMVENTVNNLKQQATSAANGLLDGAKTTTKVAGEVVSEGANAAESVADVAKTAESSVGKGLTSALEGAACAGAKGIASKVSGVIGKAGVLGSAALGGVDLYEDIKNKSIQGNNTWEKASNLLQIGGSLADIVGTVFPPARLIGGALDIASGVTDSVGEKLEEDKTSKDLKQEQSKETDKTVTAGSLQKQQPSLIGTTGLTAVTGRVQ